jgi:hypothetical protein
MVTGPTKLILAILCIATTLFHLARQQDALVQPLAQQCMMLDNTGDGHQFKALLSQRSTLGL